MDSTDPEVWTMHEFRKVEMLIGNNKQSNLLQLVLLQF